MHMCAFLLPLLSDLWATDLLSDLCATVLNMLKTPRRPWRPWRCLDVLCTTLERPMQPFGILSAFNGDLVSFVVAQGRQKSRSPCVKGVLLNYLFRHRSKKASKWPLWGNSLVTGEFPAQRASNAENVSIWLRHHEVCIGDDCVPSGVKADIKSDSRLAHSQWQMSLQSNTVSHRLGANLESALKYVDYSMTTCGICHGQIW